jgi:hypothetical protein
MLKYKNVKFLQLFAKKVSAFVNFCQISDMLLHVFAPFFSCPFYPYHPCCQSTSIYRLKTNIRARRTKKTAISPQFLNFKKFHFSIMLICVTLRTAISTGTKNRAFGSRQNKLADVTVAGQFQRQKMLFRLKKLILQELYFRYEIIRKFIVAIRPCGPSTAACAED